MNLLHIGLLLALLTLSSCASSYTVIHPEDLSYKSMDIKNGVTLEFKYDLLNQKYANKEINKGIKVVAVKITNNSERDIVFGKDIKLVYGDGSEFTILESEHVFKSLKQRTLEYFLYLFLIPVPIENFRGGKKAQFYPIDLAVGPSIAGINMHISRMGNSQFKKELLEFNINGTTIQQGETKTGLIGIKTNSYESILLSVD